MVELSLVFVFVSGVDTNLCGLRIGVLTTIDLMTDALLFFDRSGVSFPEYVCFIAGESVSFSERDPSDETF